MCVELPTFLFLKDLATDPKTLSSLSITVRWHSSVLQGVMERGGRVGGSSIRHKLSYPLKRNEKVYRIL